MSIPALPPIPTVDLPVLDPPHDYRGTVRHALAQAADLITQRGWSCGEWVDAAGQFCLAGAINEVVAGDVHVAAWGEGPTGILLAAAKGALARRITTIFGWRHRTYGTYHHGYDGPITKWNDAVCSDAGAALAMLMDVTDADIDAAIEAAHGERAEETAAQMAFYAQALPSAIAFDDPVLYNATYGMATFYPITQGETDTVNVMFKSLTFV